MPAAVSFRRRRASSALGPAPVKHTVSFPTPLPIYIYSFKKELEMKEWLVNRDEHGVFLRFSSSFDCRNVNKWATFWEYEKEGGEVERETLTSAEECLRWMLCSLAFVSFAFSKFFILFGFLIWTFFLLISLVVGLRGYASNVWLVTNYKFYLFYYQFFLALQNLCFCFMYLVFCCCCWFHQRIRVKYH